VDLVGDPAGTVNVTMPNDLVTTNWVELPVVFGPEPAVCVGLIALANDGTVEADVHDYLRAADIRICTTRVRTPLRNTLASLIDLGDTIDDATAVLVPEGRLDVVAFGCTSGAMALGPETVRAKVARGRPSLHVTDPVSAAMRGLARLGARRIALLTPYVPEVNAMVERFLTDHGLELRASGFFPISNDNERGRVTQASVLEAARRVTADPTIEALFISCTALRSAGLIERVEDCIGRPVIASNQAMCWDSLRLAGDTRTVAGAGRLFQLV
jgi:maleate isomerase